MVKMAEGTKNGTTERNVTSDPAKENDHGFHLYPERRSKEPKTFINHFWESFSLAVTDKKVCEDNVSKVVKKNPLVKVLLGALEKAGCPVDIKRHIVCEPCDKRVTGGYDTECNQIVICQNHSKPRVHPEVVLIHELIHMFDYCTGEVDFKNLEHLACSEIRAANIAHCSFLSSVLLGQSSFINIKKTHQYCVKMKAVQTMQLARNIDFDTALTYVLNVFDKCYNDLEPVGRRPRRNSSNPEMIYNEAKYYGKCDL